MQPRTLAILALAMLTLHTPGAAAAPLPDALGYVQVDGLVQVLATAGDVEDRLLPPCAESPEPGAIVAGVVQGECFLVTQDAGCQPIVPGIDDVFPFVYVTFHEDCFNWLWDELGFQPSDILEDLPIRVQIHT